MISKLDTNLAEKNSKIKQNKMEHIIFVQLVISMIWDTEKNYKKKDTTVPIRKFVGSKLSYVYFFIIFNL